MARILVVDDDELFSYTLKRVCERQGNSVIAAASVRETKELSAESFDIVFLDIELPDGNGLQLLPLLRAGKGQPEVLVITGHSTKEWLEEALQTGAWDYIRKDDSLENILAALEQALLYHQSHASDDVCGQNSHAALIQREQIVGESRAVTRCIEQMASCAERDICVLITGETGTGKELFAHAVHNNSMRKNAPFVTVDCASLPDNLAESILFGHVRGAFTGAATRQQGLIAGADGGTLFLDEVGELPLNLQKVFLRVLQEKTVLPVGATHAVPCDFRLIAATNRNLESMVEEGTFRKDLYYRLQSATLLLPPLRERQEDILLLAEHFIQKFCTSAGLPPKHLAGSAKALLLAYSWQGNVRELCGAMEQAVITAGQNETIFLQYLPTRIRIQNALQQGICDVNNVHRTLPSDRCTRAPLRSQEIVPYSKYKEDYWLAEEGRYLARVLALTGGDIAAAGAALELSRSRLYALLKRHNLR